MLFRLPNGFIDGLYHFSMCEVGELKGKHQNYLANRELVEGNIGHLPKILSDLIIRVETDTGVEWKGSKEELLEKLVVGDLEAILIKIREASFGVKYYFDANCEECGKTHKGLRINLDTLEYKTMTPEQLMQTKVVQLPKSGLEVELRPQYLKDLFEVINITKNKQDSLITSSVVTSVRRIGDKTKLTSEDFDDLPASDLIFLMTEVGNTTLEEHIDTLVTSTCKGCGKDFEYKIPTILPSFFYPSEA